MTQLYKVRIFYFKNGRKRETRQCLRAESFDAAVARARVSFKVWLQNGNDVQIFNPGEPTTLPLTNYKGI